MIFVTVGTELPFNRLVRVVDTWAKEAGRTDVFAQIGKTDWKPSSIPSSRFLNPQQFTRHFEEASTIVSHAGMGTILSALHLGKPILVMPRLASLGEQRNEHQLATAKRMLEMRKVHVAFDEAELRQKLLTIDRLAVESTIGKYCGADLVSAIRNFIHQQPKDNTGR